MTPPRPRHILDVVTADLGPERVPPPSHDRQVGRLAYLAAVAGAMGLLAIIVVLTAIHRAEPVPWAGENVGVSP